MNERLKKAALDVIDDLERYAGRSGPGPDARLLELKGALGIEVPPPAGDDPLSARRKVAEFATYLDGFLVKLKARVDAYYAEHYEHVPPPTFRAPLKGTRRYVKVVRYDEAGSRSVHCFVEKATGLYFKPASWSAAAPHARGSIYATNPLEGITPSGSVVYLA